MPWLAVRDREPNRLERWAAFLLPPLHMGDEFASTGGDLTSRLRVVGPGVFDVIASVVTRYRLRRRQREQQAQVSLLPSLYQ